MVSMVSISPSGEPWARKGAPRYGMKASPTKVVPLVEW
jgi:hypothetical protein